VGFQKEREVADRGDGSTCGKNRGRMFPCNLRRKGRKGDMSEEEGSAMFQKSTLSKGILQDGGGTKTNAILTEDLAALD